MSLLTGILLFAGGMLVQFILIVILAAIVQGFRYRRKNQALKEYDHARKRKRS